MRSTALIVLISTLLLLGCQDKSTEVPTPQTEISAIDEDTPELTIHEANRLASLPYHCMQVEFPNKLGQTLNDASHIHTPKVLHPAFYGCFDWHSSVHGHWSLVNLLMQYPDLNDADDIKKILAENLTKENIAAEVDYFSWEGNKSYERTYGWAWLLKLDEALGAWDDPLAKELRSNLAPLTKHISDAYKTFLPKLNYPIRVGEHTNTAFGLSLALDYARSAGDQALERSIIQCATRFYTDDVDCPIIWEPSGYDFLSPCLEEANLMRKILRKEEYKVWLNRFLPSIASPNFELTVGKVSDRSDGKLVHLDGLNFSRAWCLYGIAETLPEYTHLRRVADHHLQYSLPSIVDDNYSGTHWLGTFALQALQAGGAHGQSKTN